jgi:hypothetical protein
MLMNSAQEPVVTGRFTVDGDDELEGCLAALCQSVLDKVQSLIPSGRLAGLVLGGGYGRGEGGVLKTPDGDRPYNDLEFYVFIRGNRLLNERRYGGHLAELIEPLSAASGLHIEFKLESLERLRGSPISMFSYDLVSAHRIVWGPANIFEGCEHHTHAAQIPLSEATRLLLNRCTGLLLARAMLRSNNLGPDEMDFIGRNIAKAQMALGDAVLAAGGAYHWSCVERQERLAGMQAEQTRLPGLSADALQEIKLHHQAGVAFKLRPERVCRPRVELESAHSAVSRLARRVWFWIENARLSRRFESDADYACADLDKCPGTSSWRNLMLNLRTFGLSAVLGRRGWRYPRERLLNALPLLLWNADLAQHPPLLRRVRSELNSQSREWPHLVAAYQNVWTRYG